MPYCLSDNLCTLIAEYLRQQFVKPAIKRYVHTTETTIEDQPLFVSEKSLKHTNIPLCQAPLTFRAFHFNRVSFVDWHYLKKVERLKFGVFVRHTRIDFKDALTKKSVNHGALVCSTVRHTSKLKKTYI